MNYRVFIESTGVDYLRVSLQGKRGVRWRSICVSYCYASNDERLSSLVRGYATCYGVGAHQVVDARRGLPGESLASALVREVKLRLELYTWRKQLERLQREASALHYASGGGRRTRRKYWIMTDHKGRPLLMSSQLKDAFKRKGYYDKRVSAMDLNKECIWSTDSLYGEN